ncbi:MAG: guanylate kinase [Helicobacteraceae bacterium]|jgi:guanylate kinase|nr:guanylate kinase [Helicobacteraceae bacterium]
MNGSLVVVSGPSGSGKSSLCKKICGEFEFASLSISTTTRKVRAGEKDGVDYFFTDESSFQDMAAKGEFLEWAQVHGNLYGTSRVWVERALESGRSVIFDIDVQGQASIVRLFPKETTSIFLTTPSARALRSRLVGRGTDDQEAIEERLINARKEMESIDLFDYLLVNDSFDESYNLLRGIVLASRIKCGAVSLSKFISNWSN